MGQFSIATMYRKQNKHKNSSMAQWLYNKFQVVYNTKMT